MSLQYHWPAIPMRLDVKLPCPCHGVAMPLTCHWHAIDMPLQCYCHVVGTPLRQQRRATRSSPASAALGVSRVTCSCAGHARALAFSQGSPGPPDRWQARGGGPYPGLQPGHARSAPHPRSTGATVGHAKRALVPHTPTGHERLVKDQVRRLDARRPVRLAAVARGPQGRG